jgi:hypothetical protein
MALANLTRPNAVVVEAFVENCNAEVYLNDIPLGRIFGDGVRNPNLGLTFNDYATQGPNTLEIVVEPGDTPSVARTQGSSRDTGGMTAAARVSLYPPGLAIGEPGFRELQLVSFVGDGNARQFPYAVSAEVSIPTNFPEWEWERAPVLTLNAALVQEATQFLADFRRVYLHRDLAAQNALSELYMQEGCLALGEDFRERRAMINDLLTGMWQSPGWDMEPLEPDTFDFRLCAKGRLLQCISKTWQPVVSTTRDEEGERLMFPLFLGRVNGRLAWLR